MRLGVVLLAVGMCGSVWAQEPGLARRDAAARSAIAPPPAALKPAEKPEAPRTANTYANYQALRQRTANGASFAVKDLKLTRDAGVFTLTSGVVTLYGEVAGSVTGAVFEGEGTAACGASDRRWSVSSCAM